MENLRLLIAARPQAVAAILKKYGTNKSPKAANVAVAYQKFGYPFAKDLYNALSDSFNASQDGSAIVAEDTTTSKTGFGKFLEGLGDLFTIGASTWVKTKTMLDKAKEEQQQQQVVVEQSQPESKISTLFTGQNLIILAGILLLLGLGIWVIKKIL
ncbi:MAG: hypothetical protein PHS93_10320 [Candidatus Omnitrophica bacterium]|nr:hypothetical protein [Candidatus Omnitrophota bacterium]MDD5353545.1 hypothetical protein [Candidatus Omnitrophota bacterium]